MMPEDAPTWTEERTQEEIVARLPKGWRFFFGKKDGLFHGFYRDETQEQVWETFSVAANLALFDAFVFLVMRTQKPPREGSPWVRRRELTLDRVHKDAARLSAPTDDPPDVDPQEVDAVYRGHKHSR